MVLNYGEMDNWGSNLRKLREERQQTQAELARIFVCNVSNVTHMENGRIDGIKQSYLYKLAAAWDMSPAELSAKLYGGGLSAKLVSDYPEHQNEIIRNIEQLKELLKKMGKSPNILNDAQVAFSGKIGDGLTSEDVRALVDMAEYLKKKNLNEKSGIKT